MGVTWIRLDVLGSKRSPERPGSVIKVKHINGKNSLVEYATRLHNKELRIRDLPVEDKVAAAA